MKYNFNGLFKQAIKAHKRLHLCTGWSDSSLCLSVVRVLKCIKTIPVPYFFGYKTRVFPSKTIPKKGKTHTKAKFHRNGLDICSQSREGKDLSYSQINIVDMDIHLRTEVLHSPILVIFYSTYGRKKSYHIYSAIRQGFPLSRITTKYLNQSYEISI